MTDASRPMRRLIVSIGPVQSFVAEARRTRDLWAGSFLLSWLTGKAMAAVTAAGGQILVPVVTRDPLFMAISGTPLGTTRAPFIGSLPNQFSADLPCDTDPVICRDAVEAAWCALGRMVYDRFVAKDVASLAKGGEVALRALWDRQMRGFWEVVWVAGPAQPVEPGHEAAPAPHHWLAMRKAWRSYLPPAEDGDPAEDGRPAASDSSGRSGGGDHCHLMGDWLEVSGWVRSVASEKARQAAFWAALREAVRENPGDADTLELAEGERLSAIALVKRLFPVLSDRDLTQAIGWVPGGSRDRLRAWPSTRYMAALPWIQVLRANPQGRARANIYAASIAGRHDLTAYRLAERHTHLHLDLPDDAAVVRLDGNLFFETALANPRDFKVQDKTRAWLIDNLKTFIRDAHQGAPSPYYAVLLMDGDRVGQLIRDIGPDPVTRLFDDVTTRVPDIVKQHLGVTIYAGGDDVLALAPLPGAIACASALRAAYLKAATDAAAGLEPAQAAAFTKAATISAAIVFTEATVPLRLMMARAHELLDEVAKAGNGRDSLALAVVKPGGKDREWVSAWRSPAVAALEKLVDRMAAEPGKVLSTGFIHAVAGRYGETLFGLRGMTGMADFDDDRVLDILIKAYRDNPATAGQADDDVHTLMMLYRDACNQIRGDADTGQSSRATGSINAAAGLILHFLAAQMPMTASNGEAGHG